MIEWADPLERKMDHPLLGHQVKVSLGFEREAPDVEVYGVGTLIWLKMDGEFCLQDDEGQLCYGWPALEITDLGEDDDR